MSTSLRKPVIACDTWEAVQTAARESIAAGNDLARGFRQATGLHDAVLFFTPTEFADLEVSDDFKDDDAVMREFCEHFILPTEDLEL